MDIPLIQPLNEYLGTVPNAGNAVMSKSINAPDLTELSILVFKKENTVSVCNISCFWHS